LNTANASSNTKKLTGLAIFTAIIVVLQFVGSFIKFGMFSISLVLVPIVVGAAIYGLAAGAYLGAVFGAVVLISGDASAFLTVSPIGTIVVVMLKGICAGYASGAVFRLLEKKSRSLAALASAIVCPVVNTGVFLLGCLVFFMPTITAWASAMGFGGNVGRYMILGLVGWNFVFELAADVVISHVILRLIDAGRKSLNGEN